MKTNVELELWLCVYSLFTFQRKKQVYELLFISSKLNSSWVLNWHPYLKECMSAQTYGELDKLSRYFSFRRIFSVSLESKGGKLYGDFHSLLSCTHTDLGQILHFFCFFNGAI